MMEWWQLPLWSEQRDDATAGLPGRSLRAAAAHGDWRRRWRHHRRWPLCRRAHSPKGERAAVERPCGGALARARTRGATAGFFLRCGEAPLVAKACQATGDSVAGRMVSMMTVVVTGGEVSNILFVDSPVGAGFSFSREPKGYDVGDISSSLQLLEFLSKWFNDHPEYVANPFYIGGDSYAGKLVPFIVQMISEDLIQGYLVGNPGTGESIFLTSKVPYAHGFGIISDQLYEMILGHCQEQAYTNPANALCAQALSTFNNLINEVWQSQVLLDNCIHASLIPNAIGSWMDGSDGRRIVKEDTRMGQLNHPPARPPFGCTTYGYYLSYFWANDKRTRDALGIKEGTVDEWVRCHDGDLPYTQDIQSVIKYHRNVTSRGYRALVYSGDHDLLVPHLGTQAWVRSLDFSIVDDWRAWHLDGQSAGFTISYSNNMTFATIKGGGHTAPEYEPERCFTMFSRWILNQPV